MPDKTRSLTTNVLHSPGVYAWGLRLAYNPGDFYRSHLVLTLSYGESDRLIILEWRKKIPCLTKPGKPSSAG